MVIRWSRSLGIFDIFSIIDVNGLSDTVLSLMGERRGSACSGVLDLIALLSR